MSALELKLNDGQKEELVKFYKAKLIDLEKQIKDVRGILSQIESSPITHQRTIFSNGDPETIPSGFEYNQNWSWALKAKHAIRQKGRCLTTREIIDTLKDIDSTITGNPVNSISGTLSGKVSKGIIFNRYEPYEGADYYYGLMEWFNQDGTLKNEQYRGIE